MRMSVLLIGERRLDLQAADRLIWIRLRQRNPNPQSLGAWWRGGNSGEISKFEVAYGSIRLRPSRESRPENSERKSKSKAQSNDPPRNPCRYSSPTQSALVPIALFFHPITPF